MKTTPQPSPRVFLPLVAVFLINSWLAIHATADWDRFRGPNGSGIGESDAPVEFGIDKNLAWKAELPGHGVSSPIVVGDRVFVTSFSGYGFEAGEIEDLKRHLTCLDRLTGKQLWSATVAAKMPEDPWNPPGIPTHGYASNTPVSDGSYVYAFFGKTGVYAYDLEGNEIWNQSVGQEPSYKGFGSAASPIVTDDHVIVNAADESLAIVWLDKKTGQEAYRAEADGLGECWTTPVLVKNNDRSEIVISVIGEVWGLNNANGKLTWYANGVNSRNAQVSAIVDDGIVYAVGEEAYAIQVDGKGDFSKENTLWEGRVRAQYATPVKVGNYLFSVSGSIVECIDAKTGERVFQERLPSAASGDAPETSETPGGRFGGPGQGGPGQGNFGRGGFGRGGRRGGGGGG
ncbi:MAG: PQQ-binding-like beta-propeller repeat protein, partial [Planctomycetota bacterium]